MRGISLGALSALVCVCIGSVTSAGTVVGQNGNVASVWANPFDPNLDKNIIGSEATFASDPNFAVASPIETAVSRIDGRQQAIRLLWTGNATGPATWASGRAASTFNVGTVVTSQHVFSGFSGTMPYTLKIGTNPSNWSTITPVASGAGTPNTHPITTISLPTIQTVDSFRLDFSSTATTGGNSYADFTEAVFLSERLGQVATTLGANTGGSNPAAAIDGDGGRFASGGFGWFDTATTNNKFITINLTGGPKYVRAVLLYGWDGFPTQTINISDGTTTLATVSGLDAEVLPIRFDSLVLTSSLQFTTLGTGNSGVREIVVLEYLPEPSSCVIVGMMVAGAALRRRRAV